MNEQVPLSQKIAKSRIDVLFNVAQNVGIHTMQPIVIHSEFSSEYRQNTYIWEGERGLGEMRGKTKPSINFT